MILKDLKSNRYMRQFNMLNKIHAKINQFRSSDMKL